VCSSDLDTLLLGEKLLRQATQPKWQVGFVIQ
jgi:hypothetical protein